MTNWYSIKQGVQNLYRWFPIIWRDRNWEWTHIARILEFKLSNVRDYEIKHGHHTTSLDDAHNINICVQLLKRLRADKYYENAEIRFGQTTESYRFAEAVRRNDQRYLGLILGKYLRDWWD